MKRNRFFIVTVAITVFLALCVIFSSSCTQYKHVAFSVTNPDSVSFIFKDSTSVQHVLQ